MLETAPFRPGKFWGLERRFRPGVTDNAGRTALEAFEIVQGAPLPQARASSGSLVILEGAGLSDELIAEIAQKSFCNELIETWTILSEQDMIKNDRFHQERIKREMPKVSLRGVAQTESVHLEGLTSAQLETLSTKSSGL